MGGSERSLFLQAQTEISGLLMFSVSSHTVTAALRGHSSMKVNVMRWPPQL